MKAILLQSDAINEVATGATGPVNDLISSVIDAVGTWAPKILGAILALIIGLWIIRIITNAIVKALEKSKMDATLRPFIATLINFALKVVLFLGVAEMMGVGITSFAAILVGVGAAIGGAFNGSLGNIASGVMLLVFRPFNVNDLIQLPDGTMGFVKEISLFVTIIQTFQNTTEIVPNSTITGGKITNFSTIGNLRVDMPFGIQYGSNIEEAKQIVMNVMKSDANIMQDPTPRVAVNNLGENGIELLALPYSTCENYWDVYWDTRQKIVEALGAAGFAAPLPQRIVTMKNA